MTKSIETNLTSREVAQHFFDEMAEWEQWSASVDTSSNSVNKKRLAKLKVIFGKYLSKKALVRDQSRYDLLDFGEPPEFEFDILRVEEETPKKHWIYVPEGLIGGEGRYCLMQENGEWRIDYKEVDVAKKGEWKKWRDL